MDLPNKIPPMPRAKAAEPTSNVKEIIKGKLAITVGAKGMLYARIHLGKGKYKTQTLGTHSWNEAPDIARKIFYQIEAKIEVGAAVKRTLFGAVWDKFIAHQEALLKVGNVTQDWFNSLNYSGAYLKEFLGKDSIDKIGPARWDAFVIWRKTNTKSGKDNVASKTMKTHRVHLKQALKWAGTHLKLVLPDMEYKLPKSPVVARDAFEVDEYEKLKTFMLPWSKKLRATDTKAFDRLRMRFVVLVLAETGMRVGELLEMRWRDVVPITDDDGNENFKLHVTTGKTIKTIGPRWVTGTLEAGRNLQRWTAHTPFRKANDLIFPTAKGTRWKGSDTSFRRLLVKAGLRTSESAKALTLYSLRHTYATLQLTKDNPLKAQEIAGNMGTSLTMLDQHYGHLMTADMATKLGRDGAFHKKGAKINKDWQDDE